MIPVFYCPEMVPDVGAARTTSPSPGKPSAVMADWLAKQLPIEMLQPLKISDQLLREVHDERYLSGLVSGEIPNGHGNYCSKILAAARWNVASMVGAAVHAETSGVACSLSSGFHHAGFDEGGAFCTYNGLVAAAIALIRCPIKSQSVGRVGILDLDYHFGDGTLDCIEKNDEQERIVQRSGTGCSADEILDSIDLWIDELDCDLLLYQAGADMHVNDPLGGCMTTEQMRLRDQAVFNKCKRDSLPVAWNLAGGYQHPFDKVLALHRQTLLECSKEFAATSA